MLSAGLTDAPIHRLVCPSWARLDHLLASRRNLRHLKRPQRRSRRARPPPTTALTAVPAVAVRDPSGPPSPSYPASLEITYPSELNRWLPLVKWLLAVPHYIALFFLAIGAFIRALQVKHRGPTHSLACLALWAAIAAPLYMACGGVMVLALAWAARTLAAVAHTGVLIRPPTVRWLLAHLAVGVPVRCRHHRPWICLAPGARRAHRSDSLGLAIRCSPRCARARCAEDPHRLGDRDLAAATGDHDRCRPRGSQGRGTTLASALTSNHLPPGIDQAWVSLRSRLIDLLLRRQWFWSGGQRGRVHGRTSLDAGPARRALCCLWSPCAFTGRLGGCCWG